MQIALRFQSDGKDVLPALFLVTFSMSGVGDGHRQFAFAKSRKITMEGFPTAA